MGGQGTPFHLCLILEGGAAVGPTPTHANLLPGPLTVGQSCHGKALVCRSP